LREKEAPLAPALEPVRTISQFGGRRLGRSFAAGLVTALCGLALILTPLGEAFERDFGLDWLFQHRGTRQPPPDVAVVGIDSATSRTLSRPGMRVIPNQLINRLAEDDAAGIVVDINFGQPNPGDEDAVLAKAIADAGRVVLYEWLTQREIRATTADGKNAGAFPSEQREPPIQILAEQAKALGSFPLPKQREAVWEFWAFKSGDEPTTAAIALQLMALPAYDRWLAVLKEASRKDAGAGGTERLPARAADVKGAPEMRQLMQSSRQLFRQDPTLRQSVKEILDRSDGEGIDFKTRSILAALAALYAGPDAYYINFYGPPGTIPTIPSDALIKSGAGGTAASASDLAGHMVFVGSSQPDDPDQPDSFSTSFNSARGVYLSGVELMATAYANLLSQQTLLPSDRWIQALAVVMFGLLVGTLLYLLPATLGVPTAFAIAVLYALGLQWRFDIADVWLPLATPVLVQLPLALLIGLMGQYLLERGKERRLTEAIGYYLPENIVRDLTETRVDPTTLNRVSFGTCLATDMSDFIALAETKPPRELAVFMNEYFDALAHALKRHGVDVMEFRADMIMCAWIAPLRSPEICRKGVEAAIEVRDIVKHFAERYGSRHFNPRVGLQDGDVYVGHTGGGGRFLYSIVGDTANTAARLEGLNKHLGTQVLAAQTVVQDADGLLVRPLGSFRLKGKSDPTSVCEVLGGKERASAEHFNLCAHFAEALSAFQRKEWSRAASLFESAVARFSDDGPSRYYWLRCRKYESEPPSDNEPVVIHMEEK
jgi:adenylate cyclase